MKQTFKNFKFKIVEADRSNYHKVKVSFTVDGERHQEFLYVKNKGSKNEQYYIEEAMKQVEKHTGQNLNRRKKSTKRKNNISEEPANVEKKKSKYYGDRRPATIVFIIITLIALIFAGLCVWKFFFNKTKVEYTTISLSENEQNIRLVDDKDIAIGKDYENVISMKQDKEHLDIGNFTISCLDNPLKKTNYSISVIDESRRSIPQYNFFIKGSAIKGPITIGETKLADEITIEMAPEADENIRPSAGIPPYVGYDYNGSIHYSGPIGDSKTINIDSVKATINGEEVSKGVIFGKDEKTVNFKIEAKDLKNKDDKILVYAKLKN